MLSDVVEKLWELQSALTELAEKQRGLQEKPESFASVDSEYQTASQEIESINAQLERAGQERRALERKLQDEQETLKKYEGQLMQVKNGTQYAAALKEIDVARKEVKDIETSVFAQMEQIESLQRQLDERQGSFGELKERYDHAYEVWQGSLGDLRAEAAKIRTRVEAIEAAIPERLRAEFKRIFKHRQGVAVTRVENGACGSCRVRIRPQAVQQLHRGELVICEGCRRIFYLEKVAS